MILVKSCRRWGRNVGIGSSFGVWDFYFGGAIEIEAELVEISPIFDGERS